MVVPTWITYIVAFLVIAFGLYRMYLAFTTNPETMKKRRGLYALPARTHVLFGLVYMLMGVFLISGAMGYRLFG